MPRLPNFKFASNQNHSRNFKTSIVDTSSQFSIFKMALARDPNLQPVEELRRWLQPTEYLSPGNEYSKHLRSFIPGTGDWLRDSEVFRSWEDDSDKGCLWVRGIAGSGKSVFAAATAKALAETQDSDGLNAPVLFFFFRQIVEKNHDP